MIKLAYAAVQVTLIVVLVYMVVFALVDGQLDQRRNALIILALIILITEVIRQIIEAIRSK